MCVTITRNILVSNYLVNKKTVGRGISTYVSNVVRHMFDILCSTFNIYVRHCSTYVRHMFDIRHINELPNPQNLELPIFRTNRVP